MVNKQIDKLVIATDAWCDQNLPSNWTDDVDKYLPVWNEKFAELIVKECCSAADGWYQNHNGIHWDPAQHIRNHFGVE